ncbi:hypothetical protein ASE63_16530 [Bosea sp. Root381]|uniref:NnrS family protein n=1 Tax=Bosea sp. Root381 TaxID=1736524 RepID=UPI0006FA7954|nr:NnrS family protein [Bosea sp. Root381]KRE15829.1 hypothetical protein ASE63_16530 [Bosea sp. Root381]
MTATGGCAACTSRPFRIFFVLAAIEAVAGVLPWSAGIWPDGTTAAAWHREALLFGMAPAVMAGFLLTALPRWTGSAPASRSLLQGLVGFWLIGRAVQIWSPALAGPIAAGFLSFLAAVVALRVAEAGAKREIKVVLLLALLAAAAAVPEPGPAALPAGFRSRLALTAILGLVAVIGGRIAPALTASYLALRGVAYGRRLPRSFEVLAALALAIALALWCCDGARQEPANAVAAILQAIRLLTWRPWRVIRYPGLLAIHLAYAWIPLGLGLNALRSLAPGVSANAVLHAWAAGAVGMMCLAAMASMVRRQARQAFSSPRGSLAMLSAGAAAAPLRLLPEFGSPIPLGSAALCWSAAFLLFLAAYRRPLGLS